MRAVFSTTRLTSPLLLGALLTATSSPSAARPVAAAAVEQLRAQVESLLRTTREDQRRTPELELEAKREREKAKALEAQLEKIRARAEEAKKRLEKEIQAAEAAETALKAEQEKAKALRGFAARAWALLEKEKPAAPRKRLVELALKDPAYVSQILARRMAKPQARAVAAFARLVTRASRAVDAAAMRRLGTRARSKAVPGKPDALARLQALAASIRDVTACSAVSAPAVDLARSPAGPDPEGFGDAVAPWVRSVRSALARTRRERRQLGRKASTSLRSAVRSTKVSRAVAAAGVAWGWRQAAWRAAQAALAGLATLRTTREPPAPYPGATRKLLADMEKKRGFGCEPTEGR